MARAVLAGPPRPTAAARSDYDAALAAFGTTDPDAADFTGRATQANQDTTELWPEHQPAYTLFDAMQTQWRTASGGVIGLDYGPLAWVCSRVGISPADEAQAFADLRVMEDEALVWFAEQAEQHRSK